MFASIIGGFAFENYPSHTHTIACNGIEGFGFSISTVIDARDDLFFVVMTAKEEDLDKNCSG